MLLGQVRKGLIRMPRQGCCGGKYRDVRRADWERRVVAGIRRRWRARRCRWLLRGAGRATRGDRCGGRHGSGGGDGFCGWEQSGPGPVTIEGRNAGGYTPGTSTPRTQRDFNLLDHGAHKRQPGPVRRQQHHQYLRWRRHLRPQAVPPPGAPAKAPKPNGCNTLAVCHGVDFGRDTGDRTRCPPLLELPAKESYTH